MSDATTNEQKLQEIGRNAMSCIRDMVAALECDYERLEGLRDARDGWIADKPKRTCAKWARAFPEEAAELQELEEAAGECEDSDDARERIQEDPLSLEVRSGWTTLGEPLTAEEFCILLSTGGPATRIVGELNEHREPCRAWLEAQDWGTPWTRFYDASQETLLSYARCFYFGE